MKFAGKIVRLLVACAIATSFVLYVITPVGDVHLYKHGQASSELYTPLPSNPYISRLEIPTDRLKRDLWERHHDDDRILAQMYHIPSHAQTRTKRIVTLGNLAGARAGRAEFRKQQCPVHNCELQVAASPSRIKSADAVFFPDLYPFFHKPPGQVWILYMLESPEHTGHYSKVANRFNWTATYRHDSDLVTPYRKWLPYNNYTKPKAVRFHRNYASGKRRKVAWFVSNCAAKNDRLLYAKELAKHIDVDIYGACGTFTCPRSESNRCFDILKQHYKFYLSFENSNCWDYITEKFFVNALSNDVVPVVMGARPRDYQRVAPPGSFIHVDAFASPQHLAQYLHLLDRNDTLYNAYFAWKGTGRFISTKFWCRMCAMLHEADHRPSQWARDLESWWRPPGVCTSGRWPEQNNNR